MGFGKERNKIKEQIPKWHCYGFFGYGHGRAVSEFGEESIKDKSVCLDLCGRSSLCRSAHHAKMDIRFPEIATLVKATVESAIAMRRPVLGSVISTMKVADSRNVTGMDGIRQILDDFKVADMTDHYIAGQFENIQNGLDREDPGNIRKYENKDKKIA